MLMNVGKGHSISKFSILVSKCKRWDAHIWRYSWHFVKYKKDKPKQCNSLDVSKTLKVTKSNGQQLTLKSKSYCNYSIWG